MKTKATASNVPIVPTISATTAAENYVTSPVAERGCEETSAHNTIVTGPSTTREGTEERTTALEETASEASTPSESSSSPPPPPPAPPAAPCDESINYIYVMRIMYMPTFGSQSQINYTTGNDLADALINGNSSWCL